jgi:hypothetical protein
VATAKASAPGVSAMTWLSFAMRKCLAIAPMSSAPLATHSLYTPRTLASARPVIYRCATALDSGDRFIVALEAMLVGHLTRDFRLARAYARVFHLWFGCYVALPPLRLHSDRNFLRALPCKFFAFA